MHRARWRDRIEILDITLYLLSYRVNFWHPSIRLGPKHAFWPIHAIIVTITPTNRINGSKTMQLVGHALYRRLRPITPYLNFDILPSLTDIADRPTVDHGCSLPLRTHADFVWSILYTPASLISYVCSRKKISQDFIYLTYITHLRKLHCYADVSWYCSIFKRCKGYDVSTARSKSQTSRCIFTTS